MTRGATRTIRMLVLSTFVGAALWPHLAWAHARLVKSDPAARSVIHLAPPVVRLWFNERIEPAFATVSIINAQGEQLPAGRAEVTAADPKRIDVKPAAMPPGVYRVRYRVLSVDGHTIESEFSFTLKTHDRRAEQPAAVARP